MSYCRNGPDSDAYIYRGGNYWEVRLTREFGGEQMRTWASFSHLTPLRSFLVSMREYGYKIPDRVFERIDRELKEERPEISS